MDQKNRIKEDIETSGILRMLMKNYQEQAIQQINFSRSSVFASRQFAEELAEVFLNVKTSYANVLDQLLRKGQGKKELIGYGASKKAAIVLISSNNKLYGDIITKVDKLFAQEAKTTTADIIVIGSRGKDYVESLHLKQGYKYFEIPDTAFSFEMIKPAIEYLYLYQKVTMYYGKFNNIISQDAVAEELAEGVTQQTKTATEKVDFIFEPSLEEVLSFFETQIFSLMFDQKLHEANLARYASRIKAMESSQDNISTRLKKLHQRQRRVREMELNKKQLQLLAGKSLWGKR